MKQEFTLEEINKAFSKAIDAVYDSGFNPAINYKSIFMEALTGETKSVIGDELLEQLADTCAQAAPVMVREMAKNFYKLGFKKAETICLG